MKSQNRRRLSYPVVLFGLACLVAVNLCATSLTVCGNVDGGPTDPDGLANGRITAACSYSGGSFAGTVTESLLYLTYRIEISGDLFGTASDANFVTGQFDNVTGDGEVYPFAETAVLRSQPVGDTTEFTTGSEYLTLTAIATNHFSFATMTVRPSAGVPLPAEVPQSRGSIGHTGSFSGEGTADLGARVPSWCRESLFFLSPRWCYHRAGVERAGPCDPRTSGYVACWLRDTQPYCFCREASDCCPERGTPGLRQ